MGRGGGRVSVALDVDLGPGEPAVLADNFELPVIRGSVDDGKREIPRLSDLFSSLEGFWITSIQPRVNDGQMPVTEELESVAGTVVVSNSIAHFKNAPPLGPNSDRPTTRASMTPLLET